MTDVETVGREAVELLHTILDTHHVFVKTHVPALGTAIRAAAAAAPDHGPTQEFAETYALLEADLTAHLQKEEQVLFPMIEELHGAAAMGREPQIMPCGVHAPINQMHVEHQQATHLIGRLAAAAALPTADAQAPRVGDHIRADIAALEADLREHIHKEEDLLFPKAGTLFDAVVTA